MATAEGLLQPAATLRDVVIHLYRKYCDAVNPSNQVLLVLHLLLLLLFRDLKNRGFGNLTKRCFCLALP